MSSIRLTGNFDPAILQVYGCYSSIVVDAKVMANERKEFGFSEVYLLSAK